VSIAEVFDLAHAVDAYRLLEAGHTRGKIVVRM
jgi:NADPH:quinone reductase-like Zn-dependent oxidoreductase